MTTEDLMRKHFDKNEINYQDTFYPQMVDGTWEQMKNSIEGIIQEIKDHKEEFIFPNDLGNMLKEEL